jgi:hypothetical protein
MAGMIRWLFYLVCLTFGWGIFLPGCVSAPRVIAIPSISEPAKPSVNRSSDYPETLAAIVSVMVRELKLPAVEGTVTFYPNSMVLESALVAEYQKEYDLVETRLDPKAKERFRATRDEHIALSARRLATTTVAVGMHKRILINELVFTRYTWSERIRVLAHELTHTVQKSLVDGRLISADLWLIEGSANWAAYKVLEVLDIETFGKSRERSVEVAANARHFQTFPALSQLAAAGDWQTWVRTLGLEATYGQAFLAVDYLIEQNGLAALVEYFRLFGKSNNRQGNFVAAFGEPLSTFEEKFGKHLGVLFSK